MNVGDWIGVTVCLLAVAAVIMGLIAGLRMK